MPRVFTRLLLEPRAVQRALWELTRQARVSLCQQLARVVLSVSFRPLSPRSLAPHALQANTVPPQVWPILAAQVLVQLAHIRLPEAMFA